MHDRKKHIGSSDIAAILGVCKYSTPLDIFLLKTKPQKEANAKSQRNMLRGTILEPLIACYMSIDKDINIVQKNVRKYHAKIPLFTAEIDAIDDKDNQYEIKSAEIFMQKEWGEDFETIPISYLVQCYWAMGINRKKTCTLAVLIGLNDVKYYTIDQNLRIYRMLQRKALEFWNNHVLKNIPPEPKNIDDLNNLYEKQQGIKEVNVEVVNKIIELKQIKHSLKEFMEKKEALEFEIKKEFEDKETLIFADKTLATYKEQIRKEHIVKQSTSKVLRIK